MDIIGKRTRVIIGGAPPPSNPNEIVGSDNTLVVSPEEANGNTIIGEQNIVEISGINQRVQDLLKVAAQSDITNEQKESLVRKGKMVLEETDEKKKKTVLENFLEYGSQIASIASVFLQAATMLK